MNRGRDWISPQLSCASHHIRILNIVFYTAYWIAFGPHGPRALPPPGENWYIFRMTMLGVGISFIIFCAIRSMARPAPKTMNAQYQEMTNEYLKVRNAHERDPFIYLHLELCCTKQYHLGRTKKPNPSQVYHPRATWAKEWCRASQEKEAFQQTTMNN